MGFGQTECYLAGLPADEKARQLTLDTLGGLHDCATLLDTTYLVIRFLFC
jgi:hypothetical protein